MAGFAAEPPMDSRVLTTGYVGGVYGESVGVGIEIGECTEKSVTSMFATRNDESFAQYAASTTFPPEEK